MLRASVLTLLVCSATAFATDPPAPTIPERIRKAGLADKPFALLVTVKLKAGTEPRFIEAALKTQAASRREPGCQQYDFVRDADTPTTIYILERWKDLAALESHLREPHFAAIGVTLSECGTGAPEVKLASSIGK